MRIASLNNYTSVSETLKDRLRQLVAEKKAALEQGETSITKFKKLARKQVGSQKAIMRQELEELKKLYSAKLGLEAPVDYWNKKSLRHQKWMKGLFIAFGGYIAVVAAALGAILYMTVLDDPAFWKNAGFELVGLTLVVFGMLVAVARILYKLAASQLHLYNDADERGTMVEAYLALRLGGHADEGHMAIVLERLFAPGSDGIVKDEFLVTALDHLRAGIARQ